MRAAVTAPAAAVAAPVAPPPHSSVCLKSRLLTRNVVAARSLQCVSASTASRDGEVCTARLAAYFIASESDSDSGSYSHTAVDVATHHLHHGLKVAESPPPHHYCHRRARTGGQASWQGGSGGGIAPLHVAEECLCHCPIGGVPLLLGGISLLPQLLPAAHNADSCRPQCTMVEGF